MSSSKKIGGKIVLEGASQYNADLKNIQSNLKELRSEMKLANTQNATNQNTVDALAKKQEILSRQYEEAGKKVETYEKFVKAANTAHENAGNAIEEYKTKLEAAKNKLEDMTSSGEASNEELEEQKKVIDELKSGLSNAESAYDKTGQKINYYKEKLNDAKSEQTEFGSDLSKTEKYLGEARSSADGCADSIDEFGNEIKEASEATSAFGELVKANIASEVIIAGVKKLANGIKEIADSAIESGESFEASMSQVAATMGMSAEEIQNGSDAYKLLENAARQCGETTKYSATQAGEALNYLALAGYDAEKAATTLPKVLTLAAAGDMELAYASDLVTDSMSALNMETYELDSYMDQMAKTAQKSNTSVSQLGEATLVCAGTVELTQQSITTMNAELGILANNGLKGAEGGTHLRNILLSLSAPTDKGAAALKNLNVAIENSDGSMRDLNDIMKDLNVALSDLGDVDKTATIKTIFNKTDIAAVNALLKGSGEEFANLSEEIKNSTGAAEIMAATMNDNLKGKITILQSSLESLGITTYDVFDDSLKTTVEAATDAVSRLNKSMAEGDLGASMDKFAEGLDEFLESAIEVGEEGLPVLIDGLTWMLDNADAIASGITGVVVATETMSIVNTAATAWHAFQLAEEGATVAQWALNVAMNANPIGLLITAIAGVTSALVAYNVLHDDTYDNMTEEMEVAKKEAEAVASLSTEISKSAETRKQTRTDLEASATVTQNLAVRLEELTAKTKLSSSEQAELENIVAQLNESIPELNLAYDEQTNSLNLTNEELEAYIDASLEAAKVAAAREEMVDIAKQQYEAEKELAEVESELQKATEDYDTALEASNEELAEYGRVTDDTQVKVAEAKDRIDQYTESQATLKETVDELGAEYEDATTYINEHTAALDDAETASNQAAEAAGKVTAANAELAEAYAEAKEEAIESINTQVGLFDTLESESTDTASSLASDLQTQVENLQNYADNVSTARDIINDPDANEDMKAFFQALVDGGLDSADALNAFVEAYANGDSSLTDAVSAFAASEDLQEDIADMWAQIESGYSDGLETVNDTVSTGQDTIATTNSDAYDTQEQDASDHADSMVSTTTGMVDDMATAVTTETPKVTTAIQTMSETVVSTANTAFGVNEEDGKSTVFYNMGMTIDASLAQGITDGTSTVSEAITAMCNAAIEAVDISAIVSKIDTALGEKIE